ncbi:MAG TPA: hypothetical protein VLP43_04145 [Solirubrobacteraceae bacterium]|nr:hypothetical protein [Solirubrobacteraceae bacterium]
MGSSPLTAHDGELLAFLADHRVALAGHLQVATGLSPSALRRRLRALVRAGLVAERQLLHRQPAAYLITRRGLGAIGSPLPRPELRLQGYVHDLGTAWLWLAARDGAFGPVRELLSERQLRSHDGLPRNPEAAPAGRQSERFAVRLFALGPGGRERLHYPDLLLHSPDGRRVALELELTAKSGARLERILAGYATDRRFDAVVYVVGDDRIEAKVRDVAARAAASDKVFVHRFAWTPSMQGLAAQLGHASARGRTMVRGRSRRAATASQRGPAR